MEPRYKSFYTDFTLEMKKKKIAVKQAHDALHCIVSL